MDTFRFRSCWRQRRNTINHHHQTSLAYALNKCYSFMAISLIADDAFIQYYHCLNMVVQDCLKCGLGGIYYRCTIMRTLSIQLYTAVYKTWHNTLDNRDHECLYGRFDISRSIFPNYRMQTLHTSTHTHTQTLKLFYLTPLLYRLSSYVKKKSSYFAPGLEIKDFV